MAAQISHDILPVASGAGLFESQCAPVTPGGLEATLQCSGFFTILAPTDESIGNLPAGTVEHFLKSENKKQIVAIFQPNTFLYVPKN
jgi:uncharacterized surface protein with fasciclin (FAS1) repeats